MRDRGPGQLRLLVAELKRRRVLHVAGVYAVAAWALLQVSVTVAPMLELPEWAPKLVLLLLVLGFPLAILLSWTFDWTPERGWQREEGPGPGAEAIVAGAGGLPEPESQHRGRRPAAYFGAAALVALVALAVYARYGGHIAAAPAERITSLAVLPFSNLSGDPENEYFSDGVTEELLNQIMKVRELQVAARTSSFFFKGRNLPVDEVGRRLNVGAVVEGSVQRMGGRVRITARLVSARTGYRLWSDRYDRDARDLFAVEEEIARAVVAALRVQLADALVPRRPVPDSAAYDLYLRGRFLLNRGSRPDLERAIAFFGQAIARDSAFAAPYAAAASAWTQLADAYVAPLQAYPKAEALARRALELDETNAEAHADLGYAVMILRWDWRGARHELERALALNPRDGPTHWAYSQYLWFRGDLAGSQAEIKQATRLEPFSAYYSHLVVLSWWVLGNADSAIAAYGRVEEIAPGYTYAGSPVSAAYRAKGRLREALALDQVAAKARGVPDHALVASLVALGRRGEAQAALAAMLTLTEKQYVIPEEIAVAALALGHRDLALDWLQRGVAMHSANALWFAQFPELRPLRSDPHYRRLLRGMGLDTLASSSL